MNNGAKGIVVDFLKHGDTVTHVIVDFDNYYSGKKLRQNQTDTFLCLYERGVPISKLNFTYSLGKRKQERQKAICIQFPLQLGYALTIHKSQGVTIKQPKIDIKHAKGSNNPTPGCAKEYRCVTCGKSYAQPQYLNCHVRTEHDEVFGCDECNENFPSTSALITHTKEVHIEADLSCPICNRLLASEITIIQHMRYVHKIQDIPQKRNEKHLRSEVEENDTDQENHTEADNFDYNQSHSNLKLERFQCKVCKLEYKHKKHLNRHMRSDHEEASHMCIECKASFSRKDVLLKHMKESHTEVHIHQCSRCDEAFFGKDDLTQHIKDMHPGEKNQKCGKCGMTFDRGYDLNRHIKEAHEKEKNLKCPQCDEEFARNANLNHHVKDVHEKEKNFKCTQCNVEFARKLHLNRYVKDVHEKQKNFKCPQCDVEFVRKPHLNRHIKDVHEKQKSFKCTQCNEEFAQKPHLNLHIKDLHEKQKNFKCTQCNEEFARKANLNVHIKDVHQRRKSHDCEFCFEAFAKKSSLLRHIKEIHTNMTRGKGDCFQRFFETVKYGPMFGCISCQIANYIRSVDVFDETLCRKLEEKSEDPEIFALLLDEAYYNITLQDEIKRIYLAVDKDGAGKKDYYICKTCKDAFLHKKLPSRCILNECRTADQPESLKNMSEVEASLIAQNLQFRKIHRLPQSRWAQLRDRVINVPVPTRNVKATIKSLPRNPSDSGFIGVNWKRKKSFKNVHKQQLVDVNRVFDGLEYLVDHNPLYKGSAIDRGFIQRCKLQNPEGHDLFLSPGNDDQLNSSDDELFLNINEAQMENAANGQITSEDEEEDKIDQQDREYCDFAKTDRMRRFQFDYDENVALSSAVPAAQLDGNALTKKPRSQTSNNNNNFADVAPGEGQIPTSVLRENQWDIKTYPHLYPDGRNGMNAEGRKVRLTNQQYLKQRLFNADKRYANDPGFLFFCHILH